MPEPCKSCDRRTEDFGGCRCQALLLTGDATATDPVCSLSPDHHLIEAARRPRNLTPRNSPGRTEPTRDERRTTNPAAPSNQQTPGLFKTFRALRHRDFRLLWVGLAVSAVGTWMQIVAQSLLVLKITHGSAFALGTVSLAQALAFFLFASDRRQRRRSSRQAPASAIYAIGSAVLAILLGFLTLFGVIQLWMILVLALLEWNSAEFRSADARARWFQSSSPEKIWETLSACKR